MIICDVDGCIFDNTQRKALIPEDRTKTENWFDFNNACADDTPILEVINMVKLMYENSTVPLMFVTSRNVVALANTKAQILNHFSNIPFKIYMRDNDDDRDPVEYKKEVLTHLSKEFTKSSTIIDDNENIMNMVRKHFPKLNRILVPSFDCSCANYCRK